MSALTLDIGYKLIPQPESEWSGKLTQAQEMTWLLINRLAATEETVSEKMVYNLLGLSFPLPFRSRIKHLIEKNALTTVKVN